MKLNKELFSKNMLALGEMYDKTFSKEVLRMYYMVLENMTDEQFMQAIKVIMETHKYNTLPKPADFINAITTDKSAQTIEAWQKIENAMARVGAYQTVIFDDPLIHGFIQGFEGGWPGLCSKTFDELVWIRKDFERYYRAINPENISTAPLIGISEGDNMSAGREHKEPPIYIGDKDRAQKLIAGAREVNMIRKQIEEGA